MDEAIPHKIGLHEMTRVRAVWEHPVFQRELARLEELERDRPFCRHGIQHLLDTARIMRILNLEQGLGFSREVVYATALLHDVGKAGQYAGGEPHEVAGERLAREILESAPPDTRFVPDDVDQMCLAIRGHRRLRPDASQLERLLFQADKASRACFACPAEVRAACTWPDSKKNLVPLI